MTLKFSKKSAIWIASAAALTLAIIIITTSRNLSDEKYSIQIDPGFSDYISSYTAGVIPASSTIKIRFNADIADTSMIDKPADNLFDFTPSVDGKMYWIDSKTVEFRPDKAFKPGKFYKSSFNLSEIMEVSDSKFKTFEFGFMIIPLNYSVEFDGLRTNSKDNYSLHGSIMTTDHIEIEKVEKIISCEYGGKPAIKWNHGDNIHTFSIGEIVRTRSPQQIKVKWDGGIIDNDHHGEQLFTIPAKGDFSLIDVYVKSEPERAVVVQFSDALNGKQDLRGLVQFNNIDVTNYVITANELKFFPSAELTGTFSLKLNPGIENKSGKKIQKQIIREIMLADMKPAVKAAKTGVIIPTENSEIIFPFEAVGLKNVTVTVFQIAAQNIGHFLQSNDLKGSYEMKRVAKPVLYKTVSLKGQGIVRLNQWNRFNINISRMIKVQPGAIYQIHISFGPNDLVNKCSEAASEEMIELSDNDQLNALQEQYDNPNSGYYYDDYYYYDEEGYDWNQRKDPCNPAYYASAQYITANILASNIGITAKKSNDGTYYFALANILDAKPMSGAEVELFDYQTESMAKVTSDQNGFAVFNIKRSAFYAMVRKGDQVGYIKLDDASSLSISNFDVLGTQIQKGLKGFIYGERGVWRPGDSLYISFILEDKLKKLPSNYPVVFELRNPKQQLIERKVNAKPTGSIYTFRTHTSAEAITGNYTASIKVGGTYFEKNIKIETIKPNRLKINLDLGKDQVLRTGENTVAKLDVCYLNGATAANLKAVYDLALSSTTTEFAGYKNYIFDDPSRPFESQMMPLFDGHLDATGKSSFDVKLNDEIQAPGALRAIFKGKVFEPGGDFSIDNQTATIYPYSSFVGLKSPLEEDQYYLDITKSHTFNIATVSSSGRPLSENNMLVKVYKLEWSWWWDADNNRLANYANSDYYTPVYETSVNTTNGKGSFVFTPKNEWGRYYIRVTNPSSNHSTGSVVYFDYDYWAGRRSSDKSNAATLLTFKTDKEKYNVGEEIKLSVPSVAGANILVSIENGSTVLKTIWQNATEGTTLIKIKATPDMAPNVYFNVSFIQPHAKTENDAPIRQYGITGVKVENPENILAPVIDMPAELKPEQNVTIKVKEQHGKKMAYTLAIVDEGLLSLTNFKTPDPYKSFYAKEALGVKTWDIYDQIMGAYGGKLEKLLAIGGDEDLKPGEDNGQLRFKPVVKFFGPFYLEKGQTATHQFKMPNYVGEVRAMLVAAHEGAYGMTEKSALVKNPLMLLATFPRVVGPDEEIKLPVNIFNLEKTGKNVTVQIKTKGDILINGASSQQITIPAQADKLAYFDLKIGQTEGTGSIQIVASNGKDKITENISVPIRSANEMQSKVIDFVVEPGQTINKMLLPFGLKRTNSAQLDLYSFTPINLSYRINYLVGYPHGCLEQTISKVFPQLYLTDVMQLSDEQTKQIQTYVDAAINKLISFQRNDGAFTYWPGGNYYNDWSVSYAGHFMVEAKNKGYDVSDDLVNKWTNYQKYVLKNSDMEKDGYLSYAYRLYTLALAGSADMGAMNRMKESNKLDANSKVMLAWAYSQAGQKDIAKKLLSEETNNNTRSTGFDYLTFGSEIRNMAIATNVFSQLGMKAEAAGNVQKLSEILNSDRWLSTQETAMSLMAVSQFLKDNVGKGQQLKADYTLNKDPKVSTRNGALSQSFKLNIYDQQNNQIHVKNNSNTVLYGKLILSGKPLAGNEQAFENELSMTVKYFKKNRQPLDITELEQGTDFIAEVTVRNPSTYGNYNYLALTQIFPSGWEIINTRLDESASILQASIPEYEDIRDDRSLTYFDLHYESTKTFRVYLNASYLGKFYLPGVRCNSMYSLSPAASSAGQWVKVVAKNKQAL